VITASFWSTPVGQALSPCRKSFVIAFWITAATTLLSVVPILYMINVFDRVLSSRSGITLVSLFGLVVGLYIFWVTIEWLRDRLFARLSLRIDWDLSPAVFDASFQRHLGRKGVNVHQMMGDLATLRQFAGGRPMLTLIDAPFGVVFIVIGGLFHPYLAVFAIAAVVLLAIIGYLNHRVTTPILKASNDARTEASRIADENIRQGEAAYAMGMQTNLRARWHESHRESLQLQVNAHEATGMMGGMSDFLQKLLMPAKMTLAAFLALEGLITPGMVIAASLLIMRAIGPLSSLISNWGQIVAARQALDRLNALLIDWQARPEAMPLPAPTGALVVENVSLVPPGMQRPVMQGLNFTLEPGRALAVIGPSASGKTSITRALLGIWKPHEGSVRLSGVEVADWNHEELGPHVGYVPQQIDFFGASVAENIARLGEVDSEEVVKAAELAGIHEMILKLPQGYDTMLGERGYPLSGGQRQRISIARALYKSPRLVVLDEPNSALDDLGEYMLMRAIKTLKAQGTMFVVTTHRPRLVAVVDEILLVNEGKQVAFGPAKDILDAMNRQKQEIERQRKESMAKTLKVVPSAGASNPASTPIKAEAS